MARWVIPASVLWYAAVASADVTITAQTRAITATTGADGTVATAAAADLAPFQRTVGNTAPFQTPAGNMGVNTAVASINCITDPNMIRASGKLAAAGGLSVQNGNPPALVAGDAEALVIVTMHVPVATTYALSAMPRPLGGPNDQFVVEFFNVATEDSLIEVTHLDPPQQINQAGTLEPGDYEFRFEVEFTGDGTLTDFDFGFNLRVALCANPANVGSQGGIVGPDTTLDNNDFVAFINLFFAQDPAADIGMQGGIQGQDAVYNTDDLVVFINYFFAGCA